MTQSGESSLDTCFSTKSRKLGFAALASFAFSSASFECALASVSVGASAADVADRAGVRRRGAGCF